MKSTIKILLLVVAITFSSVLSASTDRPTVKESKTLTEEIQDLLKHPNFTTTEDMHANVTLMLNKNGELVVLAIDSESKTAKNFIKRRLNYKKLDVDVASLNKTFVVPVSIKPFRLSIFVFCPKIGRDINKSANTETKDTL